MNANLIRLLLIEDNPADVRLIREMLKEAGGSRYDLKNAASLSAATAHFAEQWPHIILLDLGLPDSQGLDTFIKVHDSVPHLPVVILSGLNDELLAIKAVGAGAQDYLVKGEIDAKLLERSIRYALERNRMEADLSDSEIRYRRLFEAAKDGILIMDAGTGLIVDVNPFLCDLLGLSREDFIGKELWELGYFRDIAASKANFEELCQKKYIRFENLPLKSAHKGLRNVEFVCNVYEVDRQQVIQCNIKDITERTQMEAALRESETRYHLLVENIPVAVSLVQDGRIIYANKATEKLTGYPADELKVIDANILIHPEDRERLRNYQFERAKGGSVPDSYSLRMINRNGETRSLNRRVVVVNWGEKPVSLVLDNDITELMKADNQRELSLKVLRLLNQSGEKKKLIHDLLELFKEDGQYEAVGIRLNEGDDFPYYESNGFPDAHIKAENRLCSCDDKGEVLRDSQDSPVLECMCGNIIRGRFDATKPFFTEGGSFWTNSTTDLLASTTDADRQARTRNLCNKEGYESVALIPLKAGNTTLGLLQINDARRNCFTLELIQYYENLAQSIGIALSQKQSEELLKTVAAKYRDLYQNAPVAYFSVGIDGLIKESNKATYLLFGYSEEELTGTPRLEHYAPECVDKAINSFNKLLRGQSIEDEEMIYLRKDGSKIYGLLSATPELDEKGRVITIRSVVQDITERKKTEEQLQRAAKLDSLGTLAGGIAHDFNNMLTGMLGHIELANIYLKQGKPETVTEMLAEAVAASMRARSLTQQLLTFSKGGVPVKKIILLNPLIRESVNFALKGSGVKPEFAIPEELWAVDADGGQLNQVFSNLVINADHAMPNGGVINISARNIKVKNNNSQLLPEGNYVEISIQDHGIGIPENNKSRIFEPYFTTKQKGSGLGLPTSYSIIKSHGGNITFQSTLGVGTTFQIFLPASKEKVKKTEEKKISTQPLPATQGRILVMDDEDVIRTLLGRMLKNTGYETELTRDGTEAIERYTEAMKSGKPFDAVILDLTVPGGMGGREVISKLREINPEVKAIVSSGYANDPIMSEYQKYGFSAVVTKPYNLDQMTETLNNLLRAK